MPAILMLPGLPPASVVHDQTWIAGRSPTSFNGQEIIDQILGMVGDILSDISSKLDLLQHSTIDSQRLPGGPLPLKGTPSGSRAGGRGRTPAALERRERSPWDGGFAGNGPGRGDMDGHIWT